jgi:chromosome segregation ATPase
MFNLIRFKDEIKSTARRIAGDNSERRYENAAVEIIKLLTEIGSMGSEQADFAKEKAERDSQRDTLLRQRSDLREQVAILSSQVENADTNLEQVRMALNSKHEKALSTLRSANAELEEKLKLMTEIRDSYISLNDDKATRLADTQAKLEASEQQYNAQRGTIDILRASVSNKEKGLQTLAANSLTLAAALKQAREALGLIGSACRTAIDEEDRVEEDMDWIHEIEELANNAGAALAAPADLGMGHRLLGFVRDIAKNYDCDQDAHRHGTSCRCCEAQKLLADLGGQPNR